MRTFAVIGASLLAALQCVPLAANEVQAGEQYEILVSYETKAEGDGSSSSSRGRTAYLERVVSQDDDCVVREFDLIDDPNRQRPLVAWEMPARVSVCRTGERTLANVPEMEARLERFLKEAKVSRDYCGKYYFTWNVFKIECDPQTVLETIEHLDLVSIPLAENSRYEVPGGADPIHLLLVSKSDKGWIWEGEVPVDPEYLREEAARNQVVVGEISGEPVSFEQALNSVARHSYSGQIKVRFEAGPAMQEITRTIETTLREVNANGDAEDRFATETTQRKRVGGSSSRPF